MYIDNKLTKRYFISTQSKETYVINKNKQPNGDMEVHKKSCHTIIGSTNLEEVGSFDSSKAAVEAAKKKYPSADGCKFCAKDGHKS